MKKVLSLIKKSTVEAFESIWKNKFFFSLVCLADILFFVSFIYFIFWKIIQENIFPILIRLQQILQSLSNAVTDFDNQAEAYNAFISNLEFISLYSSLLQLLIILAATILVIWLVFSGVSFTLIAKIKNKDVSVWRYIVRFVALSIFFYSLLVGSFLLTVYLAVANFRIMIPIFTQSVINVLLLLLIAIILYFWSISLIISQKLPLIRAFLNTFKTGVLKIHYILLAYVIILLVLLIPLVIFYFSYLLNNAFVYLAVIILFLFLFIPLLSACKLFLSSYLENMK